MTGAEVVARCQVLARMSETPGAITRTFCSKPMREAHHALRGWMEEAGMRVSVDHAGNLRGVYPAREGGEACLLIGSHIDTVPDAGAYDGVLGVVLGIGLVAGLGGRRLSFAIEVVAFSEEEGVRFGVPFIGSRGLVGTLDEELLSRTDAQGLSVARALRDFGTGSELPPHEYIGYFEMHIEQGPVLESLGLPLGVVTAIAGQTRAEVCFRGAANHAGTTPMHLRRDAMAAAARWIALVERTARVTVGAVATVGSVQTLPGAGNVIAGEVRATLDVRHADDDVREALVNRLRCTAEKIAERRGLQVEWKTRLLQAAVACNEGMAEMLERAVGASGHRIHRMVSGAGHDAMILSSIAPTAMLFVRSPGGISHHPNESVLENDVDAALAAGSLFLRELETVYGE